ncbi:MAG: hypothetical protein A2297_09410 [Elusimicrobia bacterium RIFOXYB2_FULL_48_7]|nr:MAG: hypothetical protein A2297_09410 [Elusimicrobia bacterium RIFOXYB2_FULL_48_7]
MAWGTKNVRAVIFDMDGVIIDSEPFHYIVNKKLFADLGINFTLKDNGNFIGVSNKDMYGLYKRKYALKHSLKKLCDMQMEKFLEYLMKSRQKPIPGIVTLLKTLKKNKIKIALASSSNYKNINGVLAKFRIKKYFNAIVSAENMKHSKPDPAIFLKTARLLCVKPGDCLVIEDAQHGIQAARSAGMKSIGFQNPNSGKQDLSKADLIVRKIKNITLKGINRIYFD